MQPMTATTTCYHTTPTNGNKMTQTERDELTTEWNELVIEIETTWADETLSTAEKLAATVAYNRRIAAIKAKLES